MAVLSITKMHEDEIITDAELVHRLVAAQFPEWAELPVIPVASSGTDHAMYRLGDEIVARMPRRPGGDRNVRHEFQWVPHLAPHVPVDVPLPLGMGEPGYGYPYPWLVLRWIDGKNPVVGGIADPHRLTREIATCIRAMRDVPVQGGPPTGLSLAQRDAQVRKDIAALADEIDVDAVTAAWEMALELSEHDQPVWVHGDIAPGNLLLVDDRLQAVIDFSGCGVGDPAIDLQVAWNLLPPESRSMFREEVGADDATWGRARGRALAQALVQIPYYKLTNIPLATNARHVIREVLLESELAG